MDNIYKSSKTTSATDLTSGTLDGDRLPATNTTKKGGVPATGTPTGKYLKDDGTWAIVTGSGTPSDSVSYETSFGTSPAAGSATTYSRGDHTHGTPAASHTHAESDVTNLTTDLGNKVTANGAITGATKTKVTYDAKGLVTTGADATTADIADSADKRYCTDAQKTVIGNTSGTNTGDSSGHSALATIDAPTFTGVPAAPTAALSTNTTQLATTAFIRNEMAQSKCLTSNFTTSSVTAVNTNLAFSIGASEVYDVNVWGTCSKATSATGLKFAVSAPSGCVIVGVQMGGVATLAAPLVPSLITAINTLGTVLATGTAIRVAFELHFRVVNSTTPGSITIQCATVTSNTLTIYAGSKMNWARSTQV